MERREFNKTLLGLGALAAPAQEMNKPQPLRAAGLHFEIDGKPAFLYSGELHYFRVPKADWRRRMDLFKEAGGNVIATYFPWVLHEPEEGRFVFGQDALRDFEGFLETAQSAGLYVIVRPGPYQYSELKYCGLPGWLFDKYPQILAQTITGKPFRIPAVSYLHPVFLEKTRIWFEHACPIIARHTASHGGPIVLTQVDNELTGIQVWLDGLDYHPETMGFGKSDGRFPVFLRGRYRDIKDLNESYGTDFASFEAVRPLASAASNSPAEFRRLKDYFEFYLATIAEYAGTLGKWMRQYGVDTPLIHNSGNGGMNAIFLETVRAMGPDFLLGSDNYYNLGPTSPQNNPTPQYSIATFCCLELLRLMGYPPSILELGSGSPWDWPPITAQDLRASYWTNLAWGMKGCNFYVLTGGRNPLDAGVVDVYDYQAGIGPNNEMRPAYAVQKELGLFLKARPWLAEAEREYDCRLACDYDQARAENYWTRKDNLPLYGTAAWEFFRLGALTSALCASLSPAFCNLGADDWIADVNTPVVVASCSSMAAEKQKRIVRFLERGGKVLLAPVLPAVDERLRPCTVLADFLGGPVMEEPASPFRRVSVGDIPNIPENGAVYVTDRLPAGAEVVGKDQYSGRPVAWRLRTAGGGEIVVLGMRWLHAMNEHSRMLRMLLDRLGLEQRVRCSNPNVWASLESSGKRSILFLMNLFTAPMETEAACRPAARGGWIPLGRHQLGPMSVKHIEL